MTLTIPVWVLWSFGIAGIACLVGLAIIGALFLWYSRNGIWR